MSCCQSRTDGQAGGGGSQTLAETLGFGNDTEDQTIRGSNAPTSAECELRLIGGSPTDSNENGGPVVIAGGVASSSTVHGGDVEIEGGAPAAGQSDPGGRVDVHGFDGTGAHEGGQAVFRGGDDAQGGETTAGEATFRAGDTTADRQGPSCFVRAGHCGNFSAQVGGDLFLEGGDAGLNGVGGTATLRGGDVQFGTGGRTGHVVIETLDRTPTEFQGSGNIDVRTGIAGDGSNPVGNITLACGASGVGTGDAGDIILLAGSKDGVSTVEQAGMIELRAGQNIGSGTHGMIRYRYAEFGASGRASAYLNAITGVITLTLPQAIEGAYCMIHVDGAISPILNRQSGDTINGTGGSVTLSGDTLYHCMAEDATEWRVIGCAVSDVPT